MNAEPVHSGSIKITSEQKAYIVQQDTSQSNESRTTPATLSPEGRARAAVYRMLATLLAAPPTTDTLDMVKKLDLVQSIANPDAAAAAIFAAWQALKGAAESASAAALDDEFHKLFIGISRGELMPYASWYLTGFLMEKPLADLRADLQVLGLEQHEDIKEPEDHVAALCEAMTLLIESGDDNVASQQSFFANHMLPWMGQFFDDLQAAPSADFYRTVGRFGGRFLEIEKQYMAMPV